MKKEYLLRLKNNPHYKLSMEQQEELDKFEEPVLEYGFPNIHNQEFERHPTTIKKKKRKKI